MSASHEDLTPPPAGQEGEPDDFLELLKDLPALLQAYFADGLSLLETEAKLALRSLVLIFALIFCLAGLIAGSWLVLVVLGAYSAWQAGVPGWGVALGVLILHVLAFMGLAQQMRALARYLFFPNTRKAAAELLSRPQPPEA